MSVVAEPLSHEQQMEEYAKDISNYTRYIAAILKEAFDSEIEFDAINKIEDCKDGD
tara:strand:- start:4393 stop:4560 length:168 start_codon:yes stop_codon:yes gene_type:complete